MGGQGQDDSEVSLPASLDCGIAYSRMDVTQKCWSEVVESLQISGAFDERVVYVKSFFIKSTRRLCQWFLLVL